MYRKNIQLMNLKIELVNTIKLIYNFMVIILFTRKKRLYLILDLFKEKNNIRFSKKQRIVAGLKQESILSIFCQFSVP